MMKQFNTAMIKSSLYQYSGADVNNANIYKKNCPPFTGCKSRMSNTQVPKAKFLDVAIPMYNLIEFSNNYSKANYGKWEYRRNKPALKNGDIAESNGINATTDLLKL